MTDQTPKPQTQNLEAPKDAKLGELPRAEREALLDAERRRYTDLLDTLEVSPEVPERLRAASRRVDDLRYAATLTPHGADTQENAP